MHFDREQVALRLLVLIALGLLQRSVGGVLGLLYLFLPFVAAILISGKGSGPFLEHETRWLRRLLEWVVALYGYLMFVTDRFPLESSRLQLRLEVHPSGTPTIGSALLRLLTSLPHILVLALVSVVSCLVALVLAVVVLFTERCPPGLHRFQREVLGWLARLLAYHASLVESYPPFSLREAGPPPTTAGGPAPTRA